MLKQRVITAAILIPLFLLLLFKLSMREFSLVTAMVVFWAATEWSVLMGVKTVWRRLIFPVVVMICLLGVSFYPIPRHILYVALGWWIAAFILMLAHPVLNRFWRNSIVLRALMGILVLVPCWFALTYLRYPTQGAFALLYLFIIIWGADISAYFVGRRWGTHKIAPAISPGKSWEGLAGALIVSVILVFPIAFFYQLPYDRLPGMIVLSIVTVLFSIVGDLFESLLKRNAGLKDSGVLLPGHGGILDRIDSLCAAAPIFVLGLHWLS